MILHAVRCFDQRQAEADPGTMAAATTQIVIDLDHKKNLPAGRKPNHILAPIITAETGISQERFGGLLFPENSGAGKILNKLDNTAGIVRIKWNGNVSFILYWMCFYYKINH